MASKASRKHTHPSQKDTHTARPFFCQCNALKFLIRPPTLRSFRKMRAYAVIKTTILYRPSPNGLQWPYQPTGHPNIDGNEIRRQWVVDCIVTNRNSAHDAVNLIAEAHSPLTVTYAMREGMNALVVGQQGWRQEVQVKTFENYLGPD
ncbi:MAG: hypothetical protein Q9221_009169 [Calogaya cf. arnoldii]